MTPLPDMSDLSEADRAWLDALGLALLVRDDLSGVTGGRLLNEQREAVRALRADESADGRDPEPLDEAFGSPDLVAVSLAEANPDDEAIAAAERQGAGVLAQCCGVAVMVGLYLVLVWPFQHLLGHDGTTGFGLEQLVFFLGLIALVGGFWSSIRSYGLGDRRMSTIGALIAVVGLVMTLGAHLLPGPERPWWLGMVLGLVLVVAGWRWVDAGGTPADAGLTADRWYRTVGLCLAVAHHLPRRQRERLLAEARELAGEDPAGELGAPSAWARRAVEGDPVAARVSHRNTGVGWLLLAVVGLGFLVALITDGEGWTAATWATPVAWAVFALLCAGAGRRELRASRRRS